MRQVEVAVTYFTLTQLSEAEVDPFMLDNLDAYLLQPFLRQGAACGVGSPVSQDQHDRTIEDGRGITYITTT